MDMSNQPSIPSPRFPPQPPQERVPERSCQIQTQLHLPQLWLVVEPMGYPSTAMGPIGESVNLTFKES